jgi:hypothetical protein
MASLAEALPTLSAYCEINLFKEGKDIPDVVLSSSRPLWLSFVILILRAARSL